jgi:ribonucleoside-diphosphate reductase alpha chain
MSDAQSAPGPAAPEATPLYPEVAASPLPAAAPDSRRGSARHESPERLLIGAGTSPERVKTSQYVINQHGKSEPFDYGRILKRVSLQAVGLKVDPVRVVNATMRDACENGLSVAEIHRLTHQHAYRLKNDHPDYDRLATRLVLTGLYKSTIASFSESFETMAAWKEPRLRYRPVERQRSLACPIAREIIREHAEKLDAAIDHSRDNTLDYLGVMTMLNGGYLTRLGNKVEDRPQFMLMRVAIHANYPRNGEKFDVDAAIRYYEAMRYFSHATPTLMNACKASGQLLSCFLQALKDDSVEGIMATQADSASISSRSGGISVSVSNMRAKGSFIAGTNGTSSGVEKLARSYRQTIIDWFDQAGRRKGAVAIYLEPWHADIFTLLHMNLPSADATAPREVKTAIWTPDLFMRAVAADADWHLFSPDEAPGLYAVHGEEFDALYARYVQEKRYRKVVRAREVYGEILRARVETGVPYYMFKDAANKLSNQKHLGTIRSSNLCIEIIEFSDENETACCTLGALLVPELVGSRAVTEGGRVLRYGEFNYQLVYARTRDLTRGLDAVIDHNRYPTESTRRSNLRNRPMSIGVSGLADAHSATWAPYDSEIAARQRLELFETIYFAALSESADLAEKYGPYPSYEGSPASRGELHPDLWDSVNQGTHVQRPKTVYSGRWDWAALRARIAKTGLRNSLFVGPMPTATTAGLFGYSESFAPHAGIVYKRKTLAGTFLQVNRQMVADLSELGLWSPALCRKIIAAGGNVTGIEEIPQAIRDNFKTSWDVKSSYMLRDAARWAPFVDQNMSRSMYSETLDEDLLTSYDFLAWELGLKSSSYYTYSAKNIMTNFADNPAASRFQQVSSEEMRFSTEQSVQLRSGQAAREAQRVVDAEEAAPPAAAGKDDAPGPSPPVREESDARGDESPRVKVTLSESFVCTLQEGCTTCG